MSPPPSPPPESRYCFFFIFHLKKVGQVLNYDEVVVYREEAALPTYLIAYSFY